MEGRCDGEQEPLGSSTPSCKTGGFSHGCFVLCAEMRFAPQETPTYLVKAVTAERRRLFHLTVKAELLERTILDSRSHSEWSEVIGSRRMARSAGI
jgi:hypothetical protein